MVSRRIIQRAAFAGLLLVIAAVGSRNVYDRSDFGVTFRDSNDGTIEISSTSNRNELQPGDILKSIGGVEVASRAQAEWLSTGLLDNAPRRVDVVRNSEPLSITVTPTPTHHLLFIPLNALLGLTFIAIGLMVWWGGVGDALSTSFVRLVVVSGCSILLFSQENQLQPLGLHYLYTALWLFAYSFIPAALIVFFIRFTRRSLARWNQVALYGIGFAIASALLIAYVRAYPSLDPAAISLFDRLFTELFTPWQIYAFAMVIYFSLAVFNARSSVERHRIRWLLIVTLIGLAPFYICYKAPQAFHAAPVLPLWATFGMMLILPIGWGMAVASFRMLNLEWALSRTIVYTLSVVMTVYILLTVSLIVGQPFADLEKIPWLQMLLGGAALLGIGSAALASPVRKFVDKVYYADWFDLRDALRKLGDELSRAVSPDEVKRILTGDLPQVMGLEWVSLGVGNSPSAASPTDDEMTIRLMQAERQVGTLTVGPKQSRAPFSDRDRTLLDGITAAASTALANITLMQRLLEQEKRALAADMAGGIAHEINNALSPMLGQAELIQYLIESGKSIEPAKVQPSLEIILSMNERIRRIALNLAHLSEPPRLEMEPLYLSEVAREAVALMTETSGRIKRFSTTNPAAKFQLEVLLDDGGLMIEGDRQQLGQIYLNLIVNAADALEERGWGKLTVGVKPSPDGRGVIGFVSDDGPGIPANLRDRIFQPYFTTKARGKGTGLGLAIVRQIAELHKGSVKLESSPEVGTRFEVWLPRDFGF